MINPQGAKPLLDLKLRRFRISIAAAWFIAVRNVVHCVLAVFDALSKGYRSGNVNRVTEGIVRVAKTGQVVHLSNP